MLGLDNPLHILIVLVVVLLVFGAKRLPEMGKSLGEGLRGFKSSVSGESDDHPSMIAELHSAPADKHTVSSDTDSVPATDHTPATPVA
jgi:sec-independent protein translocase protein TatA